MRIDLSLPTMFQTADLAALVLLFVGWFTIGWVTEHPPAGRPSVSILMMRFRREWMLQFITRDPRIFDSNILASLREGTAFFASACMIATGGILALIGNTDQLRGLVQEFDLDRGLTILWEVKLLVTMFFVVNAFLKFVWAHRLFGYCAIMIDHGNGYQTLYAHLSSVSARCGQSVYTGTYIGAFGSTGNSTGTHLHFEVRYLGGFINPWYVLPAP